MGIGRVLLYAGSIITVFCLSKTVVPGGSVYLFSMLTVCFFVVVVVPFALNCGLFHFFVSCLSEVSPIFLSWFLCSCSGEGGPVVRSPWKGLSKSSVSSVDGGDPFSIPGLMLDGGKKGSVKDFVLEAVLFSLGLLLAFFSSFFIFWLIIRFLG